MKTYVLESCQSDIKRSCSGSGGIQMTQMLSLLSSFKTLVKYHKKFNNRTHRFFSINHSRVLLHKTESRQKERIFTILSNLVLTQFTNLAKQK